MVPVSIKVQNLTVSLCSGMTIAKDISFEMERGKMLSIVGSSGAGKTTVCRAIMGLLGDNYIVRGSIQFQGKDLLTLSRKQLCEIHGKEICYIMQNPMTAFNPSIRIGTQLCNTYLRHQAGQEKNEILSEYAAILKGLGLEDTKRIFRNYPFELSGGMLQRLMIAAAMIQKPKLLIADEATTAIDACNRLSLMKKMREFCNAGMAVLFVTHDMKAAAASDYMLIMNQGEAEEKGRTNEILQNPQKEYTKKLLDATILKRGADSD